MAGVKILQGDALAVLRGLPDESVQCCVTSPPYWGLRDYGTAKWEGGDAACDHRANGERRQIPYGDGRPVETDGYAQNRTLIVGAGANFKNVCGKCGATRIDAQIGLERTPEEYVDKMVEVFREVRRVLRSDGTLWLNIGDSYTSGGRSTFRSSASKNKGQDVQNDLRRPEQPDGLKSKDLVGIPWMLAFALRADGWYLRQDIIWSKSNPMPESVRDRCTKAHEYLFLLTKSAKYYFDAEAIKEPVACSEAEQRKKNATRHEQRGKGDQEGVYHARGAAKPFSNWNPTRNKRDVWTVATAPYKEAHFATFPPKLIEPCILAGCPENGTVLDPFAGSGTTGVVAIRHKRDFIGIELNPDYITMANNRLLKELLS